MPKAISPQLKEELETFRYRLAGAKETIDELHRSRELISAALEGRDAKLAKTGSELLEAQERLAVAEAKVSDLSGKLKYLEGIVFAKDANIDMLQNLVKELSRGAN